jgi:hypothetical protein
MGTLMGTGQGLLLPKQIWGLRNLEEKYRAGGSEAISGASRYNLLANIKSYAKLLLSIFSEFAVDVLLCDMLLLRLHRFHLF